MRFSIFVHDNKLCINMFHKFWKTDMASANALLGQIYLKLNKVISIYTAYQIIVIF